MMSGGGLKGGGVMCAGGGGVAIRVGSLPIQPPAAISRAPPSLTWPRGRAIRLPRPLLSRGPPPAWMKWHSGAVGALERWKTAGEPMAVTGIPPLAGIHMTSRRPWVAGQSTGGGSN